MANFAKCLLTTLLISQMAGCLTTMPVEIDGGRKSFGTYQYRDGQYEGTLSNGGPHGVGRIIYTNGDRYEGQVKWGERSGEGKLTSPNGYVYEGEFLSGTRTGRAKVTTPDGNVFEGLYAYDQPRSGKLTFANGDIFTGQMHQGAPLSGTWYSKQANSTERVENGSIISNSHNFDQSSSNRVTEAVGAIISGFAQGVLMGVVGAKTGIYGNAAAPAPTNRAPQQQSQVTPVQGGLTVQPSGQNSMGPRCTMYRDDGSGTCVLWAPN